MTKCKFRPMIQTKLGESCCSLGLHFLTNEAVPANQQHVAVPTLIRLNMDEYLVLCNKNSSAFWAHHHLASYHLSFPNPHKHKYSAYSRKRAIYLSFCRHLASLFRQATCSKIFINSSPHIVSQRRQWGINPRTACVTYEIFTFVKKTKTKLILLASPYIIAWMCNLVMIPSNVILKMLRTSWKLNTRKSC